jgi:hypothetical protein
MPDYAARILRTLIQLLAGGAFAALFTQVAHDVPPQYAPYVVIVTTLFVSTAQNALEQAGAIPTILKPADAKVDKA